MAKTAANTNGKPVALITGGSDGIGYELAHQFGGNGYDLIIVADNKEKLEAAAAKLTRAQGNPRVETIAIDLSKMGASQKLFEKVETIGREVEILVSNAGIGVYGDFANETDMEQESEMMHLNVISVAETCKLFVKPMVQRGRGKILITSSVAGVTGTPNMTVYGATKAFDFKFAEGLRQEVAERGVTVTALLPGMTETNFFKRADMENTEGVKKAKKDDSWDDPADVAKQAFDALMANKDHVVASLKNKAQVAMAKIMPAETLAKQAKMK